MKFRFPYVNHILYDSEKFPEQEFRFPYANQLVGKYVKATTEFRQFAFSYGRCKSIHRLIVSFSSSMNPSLSNR